MAEQLLNFEETVRQGRGLAALSRNYKWTVFEIFCDGQLAYQQTVQGVHINTQVPKSYCPKELIIAFDGEPVFAFRAKKVALNRLDKNIRAYSPNT